MRRSLPVVTGLVWLAASTAGVSAPKPDAFDGIDDAVAELAKITGLEPLKKVQHDTITRAGVKQFLEDRIKEELKPEEIRLEELSLKRFGLVPGDFDLKRTTVDLITEQAAAFYDYRKKKLFLLEGDEPSLPGAGEGFGKAATSVIVVHELAHALADQHFDLGKFIRKGRNDDSATARMAVMEGQATWLMLEVAAQRSNRSMRDMPAMVDLMGASASEAMASQYPVLTQAPLYIRASLIFPYNQGLKFQHAVIQKSGNQGFSQVFRQPPASTQQIMHPDKYFSKADPVTVSLPTLPGKEWRGVLDSTVGEFEHSILLEQYLSKDDADRIAPHWRGARLGLSENKGSKAVAMLYASEWDDPGSARDMFDAYKKVLRAKWKNVNVSAETPVSFGGTSEAGPFLLTLNGTRLTSVEGASTGSQVN